MAEAVTHTVLQDFEPTEVWQLLVHKGDQCTLLNKPGESAGSWCHIRTSKGTGLVPSRCLELQPALIQLVQHLQVSQEFFVNVRQGSRAGLESFDVVGTSVGWVYHFTTTPFYFVFFAKCI